MEKEEGSAAQPLEVEVEEVETGRDGCVVCIGFCCCFTCVALIMLVLMVPVSCATGVADGTLRWLAPTRPPLTGSYAIGSLRGRLPTGGNRTDCGLYVQVTYPMDAAAEQFQGQTFPFWREPVIERSSRTGGFPECFGAALLGNQRQMDPPGAPLASSSGGWPVVVFSSGLSGALEIYQQICRDIASTGAIVVALEHEDGAGMYATDCEDNIIEYQPPPGKQNLSEIVAFRRPFLLERVTEYEATMEVLLAGINAVEPAAEPIMEVLRGGRADQITMVGHSFGACSAMFYTWYLQSVGRASPFVGSIYLDWWAEPMTEDEQLAESPNPFVHFTSDGWWALPLIRTQAQMQPAEFPAAGQTLLTGHQWISDTMYLLTYPLAKQIGLVPPGLDVPAIFGATMAAVQDSMQAFADPSLRAALNDTVLGLYPQGLVSIWA